MDAPKGGTPDGQATPSPAPSGISANAASRLSSAAPSMSSPGRPLYTPQFSAATQMILTRMKSEPSGLSSALSAASAAVSTSSIKPAAYEDVKRRLVMGMNTSASMTMQMPSVPPPAASVTMAMPTPVAPPPPTVLPAPIPPPMSTPHPPRPHKGPGAGLSAIRMISSGLTASGKIPTVKKPSVKVLSADSKVKKPKASTSTITTTTTTTTTAARLSGAKRARAKDQNGELASFSSFSSPSDLSDHEPIADDAPPPAPLPPPTMTKSGRQVLKPTTYNPSAMDQLNTKKRVHYGKRTAEQALCRRCSRMHSPTSNQMVFCDGCNEGWHQKCHEPWIEDATVRDQSRAWFCAECKGKRDQRQQQQHVHKRQKTEPRAKESWAGRTPQHKRAFLSTLPQQELVAMIMAGLELYPDLPIFPPSSASVLEHNNSNGALSTGTSFSGAGPTAEQAAAGSASARKATNGGGGDSSQERKLLEDEEQEEEEDDPLAQLWPKPGMGLYSRLPPDTEDDKQLVDDGDYEAFSVIVYDERGRKVRENGMEV
ncbi:hypothetical protein B0T17DRAFT_484347 [Bombardia bombarda]|uniref:PHD-type domain-containing protein n=1 Tax=Bombardia bombarda TaxID=252184 RepID=A0AA39XNK6_9PEZI|nr:hypothetical protein B0T17DRAFT_484347 [Bombardia bombarda]